MLQRFSLWLVHRLHEDIEYGVVTSHNIDWLTTEVNTQLRDGWLIAGGIAIAFVNQTLTAQGFSTEMIYCQAMTKTTHRS